MNLFELLTSAIIEIAKAAIADGLSEHVRTAVGRLLQRRRTGRYQSLHLWLHQRHRKELLHRLYTEVDDDATRQ